MAIPYFEIRIERFPCGLYQAMVLDKGQHPNFREASGVAFHGRRHVALRRALRDATKHRRTAALLIEHGAQR